MQDKKELIYRSILVILFIVFLAIFYGYSENARYAYFHKEKIDIGDMQGYETYVVDTRTGTMYGHIFTTGSIPQACNNWFYKKELTTGKYFEAPMGGNYIEQITEKTKPSSK